MNKINKTAATTTAAGTTAKREAEFYVFSLWRAPAVLLDAADSFDWAEKRADKAKGDTPAVPDAL